MAMERLHKRRMRAALIAGSLLLFAGCASAPTGYEVQRGPADDAEPGKGTDWTGPGTLFLNGRLRCERISSFGLMRKSKCWVELKNVSANTVRGAELRALFETDKPEAFAPTAWSEVPTTKPGDTKRIQIEIEKIHDAANRRYALEVRFR